MGARHNKTSTQMRLRLSRVCDYRKAHGENAVKIGELLEARYVYNQLVSSDETRLIRLCDCIFLTKENILKAVLKSYKMYTINSTHGNGWTNSIALRDHIYKALDIIDLSRKLGH